MPVKVVERGLRMNSFSSATIPTGLIIRSYCARSLRLWVLLRLALSVVFLLAGDNPFRLATPTALAIAGLSSFLALLDVQRNRELSLLGNLGISSGMLAALLSAPPFISEAILIVLGRIT